MESIEFEGCNTSFGPPAGWKDSECKTIPAMISEDQHRPGNVYVVTAWKPNEEDLEAIKAGKPIYLQVWGGQPPVCIYTVDELGLPNWMTLKEKEEFIQNM